MAFFTCGQLKKMSNQRHVLDYAELDGGGGFSRFFFYEDGIQTENFIGVKTGNDLYYRVKNTINPLIYYQ